MISRAASRNNYALNVFNLFFGKFKTFKINLAVFNARLDGLAKRFGLFHNFFKHKVVVTALFCGVDRPVYNRYGLCNLIAIAVIEFCARFIEYGNFAVVDINNVFGVLNNGGYVASYVVAVFAKSHNKGAEMTDRV